MRSRRRRTQRLSRSPSTSRAIKNEKRVEHGRHADREHHHREELAGRDIGWTSLYPAVVTEMTVM